MGIYDSSLGSWVRQNRVNRGEREGVSSDDKDRLLELDRENARLRMEWPASPSATWIEAWYNRRRLSSVLGYLSPIEWENHYRHSTETLAA